MSSKLENRDETKKNKLYIWNEGDVGIYVKKRGVPQEIETLIKESLERRGPGQWMMYISGFHPTPPIGEHAFSKKVYLEVPANNKIMFDFLENAHHVKVLSEEMLNFLKEHGLTENYELAPVIVISRSGKVIETEKNYFALRFYKFDNDLLEFGEAVQVTRKPFQGIKSRAFELYPNMKIKEGVDKKIFALKHLNYQRALVFTKEIKDLIVEKGFVGADIYSMDELWRAYTDEKPEGF